nr:restriction endonuclease subunit S [Sphingobium jiangsuense]
MIENNLLSLSYGRIVRKDIDNNDGLLPASFETYQIVEPDDIVWRLTDLQNDQRSLRTAIVRERGIITSAYLATQPRGIAPHYLSYLLRAYDLTKVFYSMGGGLRQSMKFADVKRLPVMLPPANEQVAIAAFLDRETAKIDALIEEQRCLISLLKEKRQAVISHAVTEGLDPHAPMKDSGIDWLGEVPAHWDVKRLRFICHIGTGDADTADAVDDGAYPFFVRSPVIERIGDYSHDCEAVLTAGDGAGVGKVYHHFTGKFRAHQRVYIFSRFEGVHGRFFYAYMSEMFAKVVLEGVRRQRQWHRFEVVN